MGSKTTFESLNAKFAHQLMRQEPGWRWREPLANYVRAPRPGPCLAQHKLACDNSSSHRSPDSRLREQIMFEPLKLQDAYVNIRSKFPQADVLLFGPAFFSKAHQVGFSLESMCEESHSRVSLGRQTPCREARVRRHVFSAC